MKKLLVFLALLSLVPPLWGAPASQIICSPKTLYLGDTLIVKLRLPHGEDFVIRDPDLNEYWLSAKDNYHDHNSPAPNTPAPFRAEDFRSLSEVKLFPSELKVFQFTYGKTEPELVFSKSGRYRIEVSTNFATDDGTPTYSCLVMFTNKQRK